MNNNNYSREDDINWYHGNLTRQETDEILKSDDVEDGSFLVRNSVTSKGDFVLSLVHNGEVSHYQLRRHKEDAFFSIFINENIKFHGLESLIDHFRTVPGLLYVDDPHFVLTSYIPGDPPPHDSRRHGHTNLLHRAVTAGNLNVVSELLNSRYRHEAKEAKNQNGQTAVHLASMQGEDDILQKLILHGANVNSVDTAGNTPLHYACQNNFPNTVRLLVQIGGANIQSRNTESDSVPLHEAASRGHTEVVKVLLSLNAPVYPRNKDGFLPSQLALQNNFYECAEILENYKSPAPKTRKYEWYHGTLDRQEAERVLRNYSQRDGTFLVRWSDRNRQYVLTLLFEDTIFNYIIRSTGNWLFIDNGPYLDSLEHIVDYYMFISDGLPTVLLHPVPPPPKPPVPQFSTMPRPRKHSSGNTRTMLKVTKNEESHIKSIPSHFKNITFKSEFSTQINIENNNNNDNFNANSDVGYISVESLTLARNIGEGMFGSVREGTYRNENNDIIPVAIKILRDEDVEMNKKAFLTEAHIIMKLNHHCIVRLIGLCLGPPLLMVQELLPLGSMLTYVINNQQDLNPNFEFKIWAAQIACGMQYLEEQRLVHRDLAARNILLASKHQVKISDFGLSRALSADNQYYKAMQGGKWPIKWYAPESFNFGKFSSESDVWSFGITLWEMYSFGAAPYGEMKGSEVVKLINEGQRLEQPKSCPDNVFEIMNRCWEYKAENRPKFSELLEIFSSDPEYINIKELLPKSSLA